MNLLKQSIILVTLIQFSFVKEEANAQTNILQHLQSPILFKGNDSLAFRDPAALYFDKKFYLFFTYIRTEENKKVYSYLAMSTSKNMLQRSPIKILTAKDQALDFSSPGNVIRYKGEWIICVETYPRPGYTADQMPRYGTGDARIFLLRSKDLQHWSTPELMKVKGDSVPVESMGRMIDPYLLQDRNDKNKWWCFYKQNGVSMSYSYDLKKWTYSGHTQSGENVCVLDENNEYILFHSVANGIAVKRSGDLVNWKDWGSLITLGQIEWPWAKGRITAGFVMKTPDKKFRQKYLMFFYGSGPLTEDGGDFDKNSSLCIAWSNDLINWSWPGKK